MGVDVPEPALVADEGAAEVAPFVTGAELAGFDGAPKLNFGGSGAAAPEAGAVEALFAASDGVPFVALDADEPGLANENVAGEAATGGGPMPRRESNEPPGIGLASSGLAVPFVAGAAFVCCCAVVGAGAKENVGLGAVEA